ncbi:hypothetical protein TrRE_jg10797, partial [Triparma retinervis]
MELSIIKEYGCVHLKNALTLTEQSSLLSLVSSNVRGVGTAPGIFHASSGTGPHCVPPLHALGESLFTRCAEALSEAVEGGNITAGEVERDPSLKRLADLASGSRPPVISNVTGASYKPGSTMVNHSDLDRPLYTMSVAVGEACDFVVGRRTSRPKGNERSGRPVKVRMCSGDAIYFD